LAGALTAVPDGSFSLVQNPAMLGGEASRVADLTLRGVRYDETRFVPLFDTFDSFVKETAVAENPETYSGVNGGVVFYPMKDNNRLALSGGFFERYNMEYNFVDERRFAVGTDTERRDKVQAIQTIQSERAIYSASGGVSYREKVLSVGASLHYYFGDLKFSNSTVPGPVGTSPADGPRRDFLSRYMTGVGATFGVAAEISDRVTVAASYNLPVTFDVDWRRETRNVSAGDTTSGNADVKYPGRLAIGVAYRPRNSLRTTFSMDVARTYWEDLEDPILEENPLIVLPDMRNTYEYRFGLEHIFYNDLPARIGFYYREAYAADEVDDAGISFGTGYRFEKFDVGIAADVSKRNSRQDAITPRTGLYPKQDRVQDSILRGAIDVRWRF
jgi:long-subunit fatty acid transport protein